MTGKPAVSAKLWGIKGKGRRRLSRIVKQRALDNGSVHSQYNARPNTSVLEHTVKRAHFGYGTVQQTFHLCATIDQVSLSITSTMGPGRELRFFIHHVDGLVSVCHLIGYPNVQQILHKLGVVVLRFGKRWI
ncbi:hypothetical protein TNCV_178281 [Trichonephila clavipes]|nr:hypothetical protein TNCV_178281 [Trichonephila clavipes]